MKSHFWFFFLSFQAFPTKGSESPQLILFVNMLKKMLDLDPTTRITPAQLLQHGFVTNAE